MNYILTDMGERVIAVGAPASVKRVTAEYPLLISQLRGLLRSDAETVLEFKGFSKLETESIMVAAGFVV